MIGASIAARDGRQLNDFENDSVCQLTTIRV